MSRQPYSSTVDALPTFVGTRGRDIIRGTSGNDTFDMSQGGDDKVSGLAGNDVFYFGSRFDSGDQVRGGTGQDTISLRGRYAAPIVLERGQLDGVESLSFTGSGAYQITLSDVGHLAAAFTVSLSINAASLSADGSDVVDTKLILSGTSGSDVLIGGAMNDTLIGVAGADVCDGGAGDDYIIDTGKEFVLFGGEGNDTFSTSTYGSTQSIVSGDGGDDVAGNSSTGAVTFYYEAECGHDTVTSFKPASDKIWINVAGVDSFDDLTLANGANGTTVISWGDGSTISVSLYGAIPVLTAKDIKFGVNQHVEDARARLDEVRAFGDTDTNPAASHHFDTVSAQHAVLHDHGLGVLA